MPLTNEQITRYSRQIIIPEMGGQAQERLLSSRVVVIASREDLDQPLAYLVGAGVGDIDLCVPDCDDARLRSLCNRMRDLNPDSTVSYGSLAQVPDLAFVLVGNAEVLRFAAAEAPGETPTVFARLDSGKIALLGSPPPCLRCAGGALFEPFGQRSHLAEFLAMLGTTEALKMLAAKEPGAPSLIRLQENRTITEPLIRAKSDCTCAHG